MIGNIIGGVLGAGGSILGSIFGMKSAKKQSQMLESQQQGNDDWYNRRYNEDATQRADAQRMLTRTAEAIKQRNKSLAGRSAVMGGDNESIAQEKALNAQAMANVASNIVALGESRKDEIEDKYMGANEEFAKARMQAEQAKSNAIVGGIQGVANAGASIANAFQ